MRTSTVLVLLLVVLGLCAVPVVTVQAQQASSKTFDVSGTDVDRVQAFLKSLQTAVAIDNRLKVASLFSYPVEVQSGGRTLMLKSDGDLQANYSRVFDDTLRQSIKNAKVDTLAADAKGVMLDNGRVWFAPVGSKQALKIIRIGQPTQQ